MKPITPIQQKIYEFLVEMAKENMTPSVREIGAAVGLRSTSSVQANLDALEAAGYIQRPPMLKRCIKIVGQAENITHVPLLGTVTAGQPILAVEEIEGYLPFSMPGAGDKELFALKVKGESMIEVGIMDGDMVIAEKTCYAENGEIVVARVENETTVKRYFKENGRYRLQPHNDEFEPIILNSVDILGKVVAAMRTY